MLGFLAVMQGFNSLFWFWYIGGKWLITSYGQYVPTWYITGTANWIQFSNYATYGTTFQENQKATKGQVFVAYISLQKA